MEKYVFGRILVLFIIAVFAWGCSDEKKLSEVDGSADSSIAHEGGLASDGEASTDAQSKPTDASARDGSSSDGGGNTETHPDATVEKATCKNAGCGDHATCDESSGAPICTCIKGYEGNGKNCADINECAKPDLNKCDKNATCENVPEGSFTCKCKQGYQGDGLKCEDVDECTKGTDGCDTNATCNNTEGGYTCQCNSGFSGDGKSCTDIDECKSSAATCAPDAICNNTPGSFTCQCKAGFTGDGYATGTGENVGCSNIDECKNGTYSCPPNTRCIDTRGGTPGYICECSPGYGTNLANNCVPLCDIALADNTKCGDHARCHIDVSGEAVCNDCESGYKGNGLNCEKYCRDSQDNYLCGTNTDCVEAPDAGTVDCKCKPGFEGTALRGSGCTDIDECAKKETNTCECNSLADCKQDPSKVSYCFNSPGGSTCYCSDGYRKEGGVCTNINECTETGAFKHKCDQNGACVDRIPSASAVQGYECICNQGYTHVGAVFECTDINECANNTHNCNLQVSTCENTPGAFNCKNINECQTGAAKINDCNLYAACTDINCETDATNSCTNQNAAGFSCSCNAGFSGGGHGSAGCYCDLSGYWAMRQLGDSPPQSNGILSEDAFKYYAWELDKFEYDGQKLAMNVKGCGQDKWPEIHVGIINEIYSTYVPTDANDNNPFIKSTEGNLANVFPGTSSFNTPTETALIGLKLNDPVNDPWPTDHSTIAWDDPDGDGEPGYSIQAAGTTKTTRSDPSKTFDYPPTSTNFPVSRRAGCFSGAARVKRYLEVDSVNASCSLLTGKVMTKSTEGHIRTCTIVPQSQWSNTDIQCNHAYWASDPLPERCNTTEITSYDNEAHAPASTGVTVTYKLVKVGKLTDSVPTCPYVRGYSFDQ